MSTTAIGTTTDQISPYIFANTVFNQTSGTAPLVPWFYFFSIGATFSTAGDYSAASANYPGPGSPQTLALIAPMTFDFGSSEFTLLSTMQAAYPFGTYTVTGVGNQIGSISSVSYQTNYFTSTVPFVTNYGNLNGFNPANDFTVQYNSFTPDAHVTTGFTFLTIWNANTHQVVFHDDFQSPSSTTALIAANTLSPNTNYTFELDFSDRLTVGSSTQGFDVRTDGSFTTGPIFQTNHAPVIDVAHSKVAGTINERPSTTGSSALDFANGFIAFTDQDLSDRPTASVVHQNVTYQDAQGHVFKLTNDQVFNFDHAFLLVPESGNTNNGEIDWGYTIADKALDFLGVGETVTVTSTIEIDDAHGGKVDQDVTVTIQGSNDAPIALHDIAMAKNGSTVFVDETHGLLANDRDADAHDMLSVTSIIFNGVVFPVSAGHPAIVHGNWGTLSVNADGSYAYAASLAGGGIFRLPLDFFSPLHNDVFSYTLSDGHVSGPSPQAFLDITTTKTTSPYSSVVTLEVHHADNSVTYATGTLVGPNSILTAAHPFEPLNGQPVTEISVLAADGTAFDSQNLSITLGNHTSTNNGPGTPALVNGYDPLLPNGHVDTNHDVAVLGISKDIGNTLGWLTPTSTDRSGLYTLLGFPQDGGLLARDAFSHIDSQGEWSSVLPFGAALGTSGGPLLSADNHVVGVQSQTSDKLFGPLGVSLADHIDSAQLADIHSWMLRDLLLV